ncbi:MAG: HD domain-containing protein [Lachnospiraceae bacterium]|nr:HD domain-containing protein [Lachnospiraceae bacterium]
MTISDFENIVSLFCTIAGLLYISFKYVEKPTRGYMYLTGFFLANFLGEYYWTIYVLVMHSDPNVSDFVAYLGWNIAILFLLVSVHIMRDDDSKRFFHPLILFPVVLNIPQFYMYIIDDGGLYVDTGGLINNIWQVGITTLIAVFCMQETVYYLRYKEKRKKFPGFSVIVILFLITEYGMWTSSCFSWTSEILSPYPYFSVLSALLSVIMVYGAGKYYDEANESTESLIISDPRPRLLLQSIMSFTIIAICAAGYFITVMLGKNQMDEKGAFRNEDQIVIYLFIMSAVVIVVVVVLLLLFTSRYRHMMENVSKLDKGFMKRVNFFVTIIVTLALMAFAVIFNTVSLYNSSVISVYEDGDNVIKSTVTEIENYLTLAETTLKVTADSVELIMQNGASAEDIRRYITEQTRVQSEQFDENFTGIYAYINGEYMDGSGWEPPEGYDPKTRDWYNTAIEAGGDTVIVTPYIDAQTGSTVITIAKQLTNIKAGEDSNIKNVVCLDVIFNHIKKVTEEIEILGKGYGMVVNNDGQIIAHKDPEYNGKNIGECYGQEFYDKVITVRNGRFETTVNYDEWSSYNYEKCTVFVSPVMEQWYVVIVVTNRELFETTYSQLAIGIMVSFITFCLISFFYYIGYKNEQIYGKKVEEMNLQVVSALATAIDAKDNYTNGHSSRVAKYSKMLAERAGYSESEQDEIYMMGLLHDVGKIGVPDEVINKPGKLTDEEYELIKKHPEIGSGILERIKERPKLATGARWHHERYGGGGYPDGISGEDIPEEARIIAVADSYDAMTSRRSYRDVMSQDMVRNEIERGMGTQFDPRFARIMIDMIDADTDYTMRESEN